MEMEKTKQELLNLLKTKKVKVEFKRLDGSTRVMVCLPYDSIPEEHKPKLADPTKDVHLTLMKVYEEGVDWRSFHTTNIISCEVIE
jgi:hypothetical protein